MNQEKGNVNKLTMLGMMTALVFVSNYLRITMPIAIGGRTSFTLANIMCCLSGLLLGPVGGVASGVGSALYDLTNPAYAPECWITLITKGIMGLAAGLAMADREEPKYGRLYAPDPPVGPLPEKNRFENAAAEGVGSFLRWRRQCVP